MNLSVEGEHLTDFARFGAHDCILFIKLSGIINIVSKNMSTYIILHEQPSCTY
jgi:hypothetical protein